MQSMPIKIFLFLFILALIYPSSLIAFKPPPQIKSESPTSSESFKPNATSQRESAEVLPGVITNPERRTALVIGNGSYETGPLRNPANDATDMAATLKRLGFNVTLHRNANHRVMEDAIREFGRTLKREHGVGLFYYAGHGMQIGGVNYLIPIGARVEKEIDVKFQAVNAEMILAEMENAENGINIVLLDACRDNPFGRSFRSASRGLAIISNAPTGTFISYSTGANQLAKDGEGRNSPYTKALLTHIEKPGLTISDVFMEVRKRVLRETGQTPWELSSLVGHFYFRPGSGTDAQPVSTAPVVDYAAEQRRVEGELLRQKTALDEEKRKLEEEKQQLAMAKRPPAPTVREIGRDGRFIAYDDGTVLDTRTNLMWAAKDNGSDINWLDAKSYCDNYHGGGYVDWRMPTWDELDELYDSSKSRISACGDRIHVATKMIDITCFASWVSDTKKGLFFNDAGCLYFNNGARFWLDRLRLVGGTRALPVRSVK